jgi:hypothetical protein
MIPTISEFNPHDVPWQYNALNKIKSFDYSKGALDVVFSGSVGSAKTLLAAHMIALHLIENPGCRILIGRRVLRDLKNTIWDTLLRHFPELIDYWNRSDMTIKLPCGSIIYGMSWDDGHFDKFRSYELSMIVIEEASENSDKEMYNSLRARLGRVIGIKENLFLMLTNPDSPSHWLYKEVIKRDDVMTFYSLTEENKFLPAWYIEQLKGIYDPKMARRMLYGEWIEILDEMVYYNYSDKCYLREEFIIDKSLPLCVFHDFNIGHDKPMSSGVGQKINGVFHIYKCWHINGMRTSEICEEMYGSGLFDGIKKIKLYGDASGKNNDTRSLMDDYEIIEKYWSNLPEKFEVEYCVPKANPPLRRRHNTVNGLMGNALGEIKLFTYDDWVDEGFRLTKFKENGKLVEDDNIPQQHITTAVGYWIDYDIHRESGARSSVIR